jgi:hypothetical protein
LFSQYRRDAETTVSATNERNVVEHIVSRNARGLIVKDIPDELVATCIMIGYPSRQDIRAVILVVFAQFSNPPCASRTAVSNLSILILFDRIPVMLSPQMIQAVSASDCIGWEHGDSRNFFRRGSRGKVRDDRSSSRCRDSVAEVDGARF